MTPTTAPAAHRTGYRRGPSSATCERCTLPARSATTASTTSPSVGVNTTCTSAKPAPSAIAPTMSEPMLTPRHSAATATIAATPAPIPSTMRASAPLNGRRRAGPSRRKSIVGWLLSRNPAVASPTNAARISKRRRRESARSGGSTVVMAITGSPRFVATVSLSVTHPAYALRGSFGGRGGIDRVYAGDAHSASCTV